MEGINEKYNWPIEKTLEWTFKDLTESSEEHLELSYMERLKPFIMGYLAEFSKYVWSPVSFAFLKNPNGEAIESNIEIISELRTNPDGSTEKITSRMCGVCQRFREGYEDPVTKENGAVICERSTKEKAAEFLNMIMSGRKTSEQFNESEVDAHGQHFYKSYCGPLGLCMWAIPVFIVGNCVGCFLTGEYGEVRPTRLEICQWLNGQVFNGEKTHVEVDEVNQRKFIEVATKINTRIDKLHGDYEKATIQKIRHNLLQLVWGEVGVGGGKKTRIKSGEFSWDEIEINLKRVRRNFIAAMTEYKNIFDIDELTVFIYDFDSSDDTKIQGESLCTDEKEGKSKYILEAKLISEKYWEKNWDEGEPSHLLVFTDEADIKKLLKANTSDLMDIDSTSVLFASSMEGFTKAPVACYIKSKNANEILRNYDKSLSPSAVFDRIGTAFMAQWNSLLSKRTYRMFKAIVQYYDHELSLAVTGLNNVYENLRRTYTKATILDNMEMLKRFPDLPKEIEEFLNRTGKKLINLDAYRQMIVAIIGTSTVWDINQLLHHEEVQPYGELLYTIRKALTPEARHKNQMIVMPKATDLENNPDKYPNSIWINFPSIFQAVCNLVRNAVKYGYKNTNIHVSGERAYNNENRIGVSFTVTSYGLPIPKEEENSLFKLGVRGSNAESSDDQTSKGFGLYIAKRVAESHGGYLELLEHEPLSEVCLPLLGEFMSKDFRGTDKISKNLTEMQSKYKEEYNKWRRDIRKWDEIISDLKKNAIYEDYNVKNESPFSPLYYKNRIEQPTAKTVFKLWIPNKPAERGTI